MKTKKIIAIIALLFIGSISQLKAQSWGELLETKSGELNVTYFENEPYAYKNKKGEVSGIEVDILKAFVVWAKKEKGVDIKLNFTASKNFSEFYNELPAGSSNTIGLGSVTITEERAKEVNFTPPYLKNISVLVTDGTVPTARTEEELKENVLSLNPVTIKGSIHQSHLENWYKEINPNIVYEYVEEAQMIPQKIKESAKYFGYVDIISFWKYLKNNGDHYIKMHSIANKMGEYFGFVLPANSDWILGLNEFFESGFGFTATKEYHKILEKHLSFEIIEKVELD